MPTFALVDGNNFYCSCERVFRPALNGRPLIVLSNNDGCAVARSQEAKDLGIKMGVPFFQIRHLVQEAGLVALSSNYALYADMSARMMAILGQFSPVQEVYSIDECFVDLTGMGTLAGSLTVYGQLMRERVLRWIGIPTCVGIAPSKTLAKMANHIAKKNVGRPWSGVCDLTALPERDRNELLGLVEVGEVWGVGRRLRERLVADGIATALDLKRASPSFIRSTVSVVLERTVHELNGIACYGFEAEAQPQKQIICSRSFGHPVLLQEDLSIAVRDFAATAAERLRRQGLKAGQVHVFIQTSPFRKQDKQYSAAVVVPLAVPVGDTLRLVEAALAGLARLYKPGFKYAKAGVMLLDLTDRAVEQADLFAGPAPRRERLMAALDAVNDRFGRGTLRVGNVKGHQAWHMSQNAKTPSYTTEWEGLPIAR
ncbi:DNA-directed DNA polymerase [Cupriavidus sp. HMR-1]|uniref:Y-family DNA polymerase n=1 Tax=Burkholderiaceae TaxID=119060 RepID=UPI0002A34D84|nr:MULTISPECIES: Y-family DNA polymerase [Burkholderiaceae]ELA00822.1 DNA-directed DNA polymerase [Cupriavidus sp. HMR-1]KVS16456.1 DNA polymerase V subunit UmuC [Burkholderia vietnamiensis]